ncbi:norbelladine synthase [Capsicum annuum]|uniref:norbelladine synthase n=1 Tax=Capsicum annuum TaxID=4072 RepID=UPI001FB16BD5|nr:norbelladine synthase [Capsicum annuum]
MFGTLSQEIEVPVAANEVWKIYGTIQLANIVVKHLPNIVHRVDILEGDGGVGSILKVTFPPGTPLLTSHKEKFVVVDDVKRVKIAQVVEGGLLDLGFTLYKVKFEVIEKDKDTCITKATIEYEVKEEAIANVSFRRIQDSKRYDEYMSVILFHRRIQDSKRYDKQFGSKDIRLTLLNIDATMISTI